LARGRPGDEELRGDRRLPSSGCPLQEEEVALDQSAAEYVVEPGYTRRIVHLGFR
jgi:hypothetical protein